jgi:hypothetical protein
MAKQINQIDIYKQAATAAKVSVPTSPMRSSKLMDGVVRTAGRPAKYADGFQDQSVHRPSPRSTDPPETTQRSAMVSAVFHNPLSERKLLIR